MMISVNKGQSLNFGGVGTPYSKDICKGGLREPIICATNLIAPNGSRKVWTRNTDMIKILVFIFSYHYFLIREGKCMCRRNTHSFFFLYFCFCFLFFSLWLNDRQPVKVLKSLNDRQSDIFSNLRNRRNTSNWNYDMSIKICQAIQKSCECLDFTLGSEIESMVCDDCRSRF